MPSSLDPSPIFLIGFMATGKTTVGRLLAEKLGRAFVDLDAEIERVAQKRVPEIFRTEGEAGFRAREALEVARVAQKDGVVVACGGGAPCYGDNLARMRASGIVIALSASLEEILRRAAADGGAARRPLLEGARALYQEREAVYRSADIVLDTDGKTPEALAEECLVRAGRRLGQVAVKLGERSYPIHLAPLAGVGPLAAELLEASVVAIVTDQNVARAGHARAVRAALETSGLRVIDVSIPPGEKEKTLATAERVAAACVEAGLDRRSAIVAVGGGVVGDLAGFVAAVLYRGVRYAQVPTTLLAMIDSAIGGKTGVDLPAGKNLLGAFWQPRFVLADVATLATLPSRELRAGFGEVLKYGLLGDPELFARVEAQGTAVDLTDVVLRCARQKARVVSEDEREQTGLRATLNLGHTVGHALEAASLSRGEALLHGEAVALGLVAAARISARLGVGNPGLERRVANAVRRVGLEAALDPWLSDEGLARLMSFVQVDKKRVGGKVRFVALEDVGRTRLLELTPGEIAGFLRPSDGR